MSLLRDGIALMIIAIVAATCGVIAFGADRPILNLAFAAGVDPMIATIEGAPTWEDGHILFDGVDDRVVLSPEVLASLGRLRTGTILIRFRYEYTLDRVPIAPLFYYGIASETEPDNMFVIEIGHHNPRNRKLYVTWVIDGCPRLCFDSRVNLRPGEWYEFALVVGPSGNTGYLNGVEMTDRHYNFGRPDMSLFLSSIPAQELGAIGYGKTARVKSPHFLYFKGAIDKVRIYDHPLSAAEVTALSADTGDVEKQGR